MQVAFIRYKTTFQRVVSEGFQEKITNDIRDS